mmetsp:Transcript_97851/g.301685  ORF Transcript_97851/g.301685 Transcript_97851/m.301685 type:complete len:362 (-) Transcript_97851:43-1128(-)
MEDPGASSATPNGNPLEGAGVGRLRWAVNSSEWKPAGEKDGKEFQFLVSLIREPSERESVSKFVRFVDQKRAVLSRLLVRRACAAVLGLSSFKAIEIARTKGKKPFLRCPRPPPERPDLGNFNFNVSHDGRWVVLASDPLRLVGVDISAPQRWRGDAEDDKWLEDLSNLLFDKEQAYIAREATVRERYSVFQRIWSAKESVTKAVGEGLDFGLGRIEVTLDGVDPSSEWWQSFLGRFSEQQQQQQQHGEQPMTVAPSPYADVSIDMWPRPEWEVRQQLLPDDHWVTVAMGPVEEAVDANGEFVGTFRVHQAGAASGGAVQQGPPGAAPFFEVLPVEALVPAVDAEAFEALRRETASMPAFG